jgi:hypothetical protein
LVPAARAACGIDQLHLAVFLHRQLIPVPVQSWSKQKVGNRDPQEVDGNLIGSRFPCCDCPVFELKHQQFP